MNDLHDSTMSRQGAIARAERHFDSGAFKADLARRVAIPSESQSAQRAADLRRYIDEEMKPALDALGFACRTFSHPKAKGGAAAPPTTRASTPSISLPSLPFWPSAANSASMPSG
jgi:hypothetical protein